MHRPSLSVVVPTYNRAALLECTLWSLTRQTLPRDQFEVVVVDDGGEDPSEAVVDSFRDRLDLKYFWQPDKGFRAGKARNVGTAIADGRRIVYLDSGVSLHSSALHEHLRAHEAATRPAVVIGYVYGFEIDNDLVDRVTPLLDPQDPDGSARILADHQALDIRQCQYDELGDDLSLWPAPYDVMWTCHVSAEREELLAAGLFDERFNRWGGEDVDLGVRLHQRGNLFLLDRQVCSVHWPTHIDREQRKRLSASAGRIIHEKYGLFETSFYGQTCDGPKFSLNAAIRRHQRVTLRVANAS